MTLEGKLLVAGATGYIGRLLARELATEGADVRCLVRDPSKAEDLAVAGCEVVTGDVLEPETLGPALEGVRVAYYLVHSMGAGRGRRRLRGSRQAGGPRTSARRRPRPGWS